MPRRNCHCPGVNVVQAPPCSAIELFGTFASMHPGGFSPWANPTVGVTQDTIEMANIAAIDFILFSSSPNWNLSPQPTIPRRRGIQLSFRLDICDVGVGA